MSQGKLEQIQHAIADLNAIRNALDRAEAKQQKGSFTPGTLHRALYLTLIAISCAVLAMEILHIFPVTAALYATHYSWTLRYMTISGMALVLILILLVFYGLTHHVARKSGESLQEYNQRNFATISSIAFLSDLLIKFVGLSVVVLSGRGDWVAALLVIYTGDYLLQGRLFLIPVQYAIPAGIFCFTIGTLQLLFWTGWIYWPFGLFILANVASLYFSYKTASGRGTQV